MILFILLKLTAFFLSGVFSDYTDKVTMMEGDSVTLQTGVKTIHLEDIKWYCNSIRIAQISGDQSFICTDVQCNEGTERFRDRLKLDHQTGSLTIMNARTTDSGDYELKIINKSSINEKTFSFAVLNVSAAEQDKMKRKSVTEGESVTLDLSVINQNDVMTWYFNDTSIAEITGDQSKICTDDQCKERFRDRLKLDHQTGSLIITDTRITDSGLYKLQIISGILHHRSIRITSWKTFIVTVFDFALSSAAVAGICVCVLLLVAAAAAMIYHGSHQTQRNDSRRQCSDQKTHVKDSQLMDTANETSPDGNKAEAANQTLMQHCSLF